MKRLILYVIPILLCSCSASRHVQMQVAEHVLKDTIYLSNIQYDSIYVLQDKYIDRSRDTLYIKDKSIEYRYKLLIDTIRIVQHDSIPYEVRIVETKQVKYTSTWIKYLSIVGCIALTIFIKNLISKLLK